MFYRTQKIITPFALASAQIACLMARPAAALLTTPTLRLFTNVSLSITPATIVSAFTEATFSGYAAVAVAAMIGPVLKPPYAALLHQEGDFAADAGIGAGQVVTGYYLTDSPGTPTQWYGAEIFIDPATGAPASFNFASPGDFLSIDFGFAAFDLQQLNL